MTNSLVRDTFPAPSFELKGEQQKAAKRLVKLYHAHTSICSQKVRLALAEKGVAWQSQLMDLSTGEQLDPWYIQLNPRGVVPTLIDGDRVVIDSLTIMHYIENNFLGPKLSAVGIEEQQSMHEWLALQDDFPIIGTDLWKSTRTTRPHAAHEVA